MRRTSICVALAIVVSFSTSRVDAEWAGSLTLRNVELPEPVDVFQAIESGEIDVRFIPGDAAKANVLIANKTDQVLHLRLPEAIAAVPVLGQLGPLLGGQQQGQAGAGNQAVGGGLNGGGNQGFGNGMQGIGGGGNQGFGNGFGGGRPAGNGLVGGGFMRIAPQKTRKLTATTVCLEHGKAEPNPRLAYRMIPVSQFTQDERVEMLCKRIGRGEISQNAAQAAAWHLANDLGWQQLAKINRVESRYLGNIKMFKPSELADAKSVVQAIRAEWSSSDSETTIDDYGQMPPR